MSFKKLFLPVGIVLAVVFALLWAEPGLWMRQNSAVYVLVMAIFCINGWSFSIGEVRMGRKIVLVLLCAVVVSLILGPVFGYIGTLLVDIDEYMELGLIVMAAMPTTLSSAIVIAGVCGGNRAWAMFFTIGLNLVAIISIPLLLPWFINVDTGISVDSIYLLKKMLFLVLLPFGVGYGFGRLCKLPKLVVSYLPSVCVILVVYVAFCTSSSMLKSFDYSRLPLVLLLAAALHIVLMLISSLSCRLLRLNHEDSVAFILCVAQKTLPMAISVLTAIKMDSGLTLVPCLAYYFIQLTLDTFIVSHMAKATSGRVVSGN